MVVVPHRRARHQLGHVVQPVAALAHHGTTVYAVYADAVTHDLWAAKRTDETWGTDTEAVDGTNAMHVSANVITHHDGTVLGFIWSEDAGVDSGDYVIYSQLALATDPPTTSAS